MLWPAPFAPCRTAHRGRGSGAAPGMQAGRARGMDAPAAAAGQARGPRRTARRRAPPLLGDGNPGKNHVLLYRRLLKWLGLNTGAHLGAPLFEQGAIQLAPGLSGREMLPEVIGFNLGYEQLPLHLLITACELNELGIDPYYFTLHVTVDNTASGHAVKAVDAVIDNSRRDADPREFLRRVRQGNLLNDLGVGVPQVLLAIPKAAGSGGCRAASGTRCSASSMATNCRCCTTDHAGVSTSHRRAGAWRPRAGGAGDFRGGEKHSAAGGPARSRAGFVI